MKKIKVYQFDAFSHLPNKGNPAGIVFDADTLTVQEMQNIAEKVGFSETVFILSSKLADFRLRYFTPKNETNLCGHATIASVYALRTLKKIAKKDLTIETKAGVLPIKITSENHSIYMQQAPAEFQDYNGSKEKLAKAIGLSIEDLSFDLPILYGSTGVWTLLVPIKKLAAFKNMMPNYKEFPNILREISNSSIHPFTLETYDQSALMHGRHFPSSLAGVSEDPITGTASGVMGAYFAKYLKNIKNGEKLTILIEQGHEIGKDGKVKVKVEKKDNHLEVGIFGTAVYVKEFEIQL